MKRHVRDERLEAASRLALNVACTLFQLDDEEIPADHEELLVLRATIASCTSALESITRRTKAASR